MRSFIFLQNVCAIKREDKDGIQKFVCKDELFFGGGFDSGLWRCLTSAELVCEKG